MNSNSSSSTTFSGLDLFSFVLLEPPLSDSLILSGYVSLVGICSYCLHGSFYSFDLVIPWRDLAEMPLIGPKNVSWS